MGSTVCTQCEPRAHQDMSNAVEKVEDLQDSPRLPPAVEGAASSAADAGVMDFLSEVQLFKRLPREFFPELVSCCQRVEFQPNDVIIQQGDDGHEFFVIQEGSASVDVSGAIVATLSVGDYFGEVALLRDEPRTATIIAKTKITALKITRSQFQELGLNEKLEFPQRKAVAGGGRPIEVKPPSPKTSAESLLMADALKKNQNLATMVTLDDQRIAALIGVAWKQEVTGGVELIKEGDDNADYFYIVQSGKFEVMVSQKDKKGAEAVTEAPVSVGTIEAGGSFGELALLYFAPRAATVKALTASTVWVIDRQNFKEIIAKSAEDVAKQYVKYLDLDILSPLKPDEKEAVAKALSEETFVKGETIFSQGEKGDLFYILTDGEVAFEKDGKFKSKHVGTAAKAFPFGERALLTNEPRLLTAKVLSDVAVCLTLDKVSFDLLLGPLEELKRRGKGGASKVGAGLKVAAVAGEKRGNILRKDLKSLGVLGCGGFGKVDLVEHKPTGNFYAFKALSKGYVMKSGMQSSVISEKNVQLMCDSPFIIKLHETYNGTQNLYFLLELALGGELYATYNRKGFHGSVKHARYYSAGVVLAFDHLHGKKILYRDLKPENLLLNEDGQIKVTDMGLAKVCVGKTYTTCGTPDYFAPELIASAGHNHAVDWWALGVLIFELMTGRPPFESATPMQTYQKVNRGIAKVPFGPKVKGPVEDLIKSLCKKEPMERLPMKKGGISNIKSHAWYSDKDFNWDAMENMTQAVPYRPTVKSKKDMGNFNARKDDFPPQIEYKDDKSGWDADFATST